MPAGLLSLFGPAVRRAFPIIQGGVRQGLSSRSIDRLIRDAFGVSIRRSTLLQLMNAEQGIEQSNPVLRNLRRAARPNPARLPPATTRLRRQYAFDVLVKGIQGNSGVKGEQWITISTDRLLDRATLEDMAARSVLENSESYDLDITSATLEYGRKAGPAGIL